MNTAFSSVWNNAQTANHITSQIPSAMPMMATAQSFPGAHSTPQRQDVIQGVIPHGLSLLILDSRSKDASGRMLPGAELGFLMAQSVQSGVPFLGKPTVKGDALVGVNIPYWWTVYSALSVREDLSTLKCEDNPFELGGKTPTEFLRTLTDNRPLLKMIVIDNLGAILKHLGADGGVTQFEDAVTALDSACEHSSLALVAMIDNAIASQRKLWKVVQQLKVHTTLNVIEIEDEADTSVPVARIKVKVNGVSHDLEFVNGKWVKVSNPNGGPVKAPTLQDIVWRALKARDANARVKDLVKDTNLFPDQIRGALQALKDDGLVRKSEWGVYRAV